MPNCKIFYQVEIVKEILVEPSNIVVNSLWGVLQSKKLRATQITFGYRPTCVKYLYSKYTVHLIRWKAFTVQPEPPLYPFPPTHSHTCKYVKYAPTQMQLVS